MPNHAPDLRFGPGTSGGFTPAGVAAFDNLRPAAVVRELIQNALDAARAAVAAPVVDLSNRLAGAGCPVMLEKLSNNALRTAPLDRAIELASSLQGCVRSEQ